MDGMTVLKNWRAKGLTTPVLILTARDSWHDKVSGIDAGADDYLSKPFHMQELLARVRALIRRASGIASSILRCGSVMLDTTSGRVTVDSQYVGLTAHELKVLSFLMHHQDEIISRTTLTEHIYAQDFDRDSNTIDVFIGRLRKKIPENMIETVRGLGYRMRASP
jgi:two-component system OmpR family response regulator